MAVATFGQNFLKVFDVRDKPFSPISVPLSSRNQNHGRITWSGDGKWLVVAPVESGNGPLPVFKYFDDRLQPMKYITLSNISSASFFNRTNRNIAVGNENGEVFVWDLKDKKIAVKVEYVESQPVDFIAVNSEDAYIASASLTSNKICLHGLKTNKVLNTVSILKSNHTSSVKFCMCKKNFLGASSMESTLCVWDILRSEFVFKMMNSHLGACTDLSFSPINYDIIASVSLTKTLKMYDLRVGKLILDKNIGEPMNSVDIILNGDKVATGTTGGCVIIFDLRAEKILNNFKAHEGSVLSVKMQNLNIPKSFQEVEMNTPDQVDNPSKTLDISIMDIFSPISSNTGKDASNGHSYNSKVLSHHSTPKVAVSSESVAFEDSFLKKVLSPLAQTLNMVPASHSSPYLNPIIEKQETFEGNYLTTPKVIKEEPKTPESTSNACGDGFHVDNSAERNVFYSDIINEIRNSQKEVLNEISLIRKEVSDIKTNFEAKFKLLQENFEKISSLLMGDIKQEIYAGNCDSKIEHISHRILMNELNETVVSSVDKVNEQFVLNALRLQHIYELLKGIK